MNTQFYCTIFNIADLYVFMSIKIKLVLTSGNRQNDHPTGDRITGDRLTLQTNSPVFVSPVIIQPVIEPPRTLNLTIIPKNVNIIFF